VGVVRRGQTVTTDPAAGKPAESRRAVSPLRGWIGLAGDSVLIATITIVVVAFYVGLVALVVELWTARNDMSLRIVVTIFAVACVWPLVRGTRTRVRNRKQVNLDLVAAEQLEARRAAMVAVSRAEARSTR
jgi:hypothetical protein